LVKLENLTELNLDLDYPNYEGLDNGNASLKKLKAFTFRTTTPTICKELTDGLDSATLAYLFKMMEASSESIRTLDLQFASPNFDDQCFGILLHFIDKMKNLRNINCNINSHNFHRSVLKEFLTCMKSSHSVSTTYIRTDANLLPENNEKERPKDKKSHNFMNILSNFFNFRE